MYVISISFIVFDYTENALSEFFYSGVSGFKNMI